MTAQIYYQLVEKDTSNVTGGWKGTHVCLLIIVITTGFATAYSFGHALLAFGDNCIMSPQIAFKEVSSNSNANGIADESYDLPSGLPYIDTELTQWGSSASCFFCQFTPVMSMVAALILGAFFCMCAKGGAGQITDEMIQPWRIVYPALVLTVVFTVATFATTLEISIGRRRFCKQFSEIFSTEGCTREIDVYTLVYNSKQKSVTELLDMALVFSWVCTFGWLCQLLVLITRILYVVDFALFKVNVSSKLPPEQIREGLFPKKYTSSSTAFSTPARKRTTVSQTKFPHQSTEVFKVISQTEHYSSFRISVSSTTEFEIFASSLEKEESRHLQLQSPKISITKQELTEENPEEKEKPGLRSLFVKPMDFAGSTSISQTTGDSGKSSAYVKKTVKKLVDDASKSRATWSKGKPK